MARFAFGLVTGFAVATVFGAALGIHSQETSRDIQEAAAAAQVDPVALAGAVNTTGLDPWLYLRGVGELASPPSTPPRVDPRVACIEAKESQGRNIANTRGSGAVGVMQYMPSTFYAHAAEMGHSEWSPWNPEQARAVAAHDLALGRRAQWTVGGC